MPDLFGFGNTPDFPKSEPEGPNANAPPVNLAVFFRNSRRLRLLLAVILLDALRLPFLLEDIAFSAYRNVAGVRCGGESMGLFFLSLRQELPEVGITQER
jgi:hypothetical protein